MVPLAGLAGVLLGGAQPVGASDDDDPPGRIGADGGTSGTEPGRRPPPAQQSPPGPVNQPSRPPAAPPQPGRGRGGTDGRPERERSKPRRRKTERRPPASRERTERKRARPKPAPKRNEPLGPVDPRTPRSRGDRAAAPLLSFSPLSDSVAARSIGRLRTPAFLIPIYRAAAAEYGVPWEVLAAINEIETDYGRNTAVSTAGALGWMQFIPSSWRAYGVDATGDGRLDPYNPVDAIFAAARYLRAAGAEQDLRRAIFAYNHANWYVDSVLERARQLASLPPELVAGLSALAQGRFPVHASARYDAARRESRPRRAIGIRAQEGAPVVAVTGGRIVAVGRSPERGGYVKLRSPQGVVYTYSELGRVADRYPVPRRRGSRARGAERHGDDPKPRRPASAGARDEGEARGTGARDAGPRERTRRAAERSAGPPAAARERRPARTPPPPVADPGPVQRQGKQRLFAHPARPEAFAAGGDRQLQLVELYTPYVRELLGRSERGVHWRRLRRGSNVPEGTVLGRIGRVEERAPRLRFEVRPAGRKSGPVDPTPLLDTWRLLERTGVHGRAGAGPLSVADAGLGELMVMPKRELERRVLEDPRIQVYECGREDIRSGRIDRRVLSTLLYLASNSLHPTVTSLTCGHGFYTKSGNVSHHSTGTAVDIAQVNGTSILGHQGAGSITDVTVRRLLSLQGAMRPDQIITLMTYPFASNTFAMGDHDDHIHVGWRPQSDAKPVVSVLDGGQWRALVSRAAEIDQPDVTAGPRRYVLRAKR